MKRLLSILLLFAVTVSANPFLPILTTQVASGGGSSFPAGAVAHWKLNEASGTRNDSVGANHLTDNNTVTMQAGKIGNAAEFVSANSEYLSIADNADLSTGDIDFTIACWVKPNDVSANHGVYMKGSGYIEYMLQYEPGSGQFKFYMADLAVGGNIATSGLTVSSGTWYFIVCWYDAAANTVSIRVNDVSTFTSSYSGGNTSTPSNFQIGQGFGNYWDGLIDSVTLWKRVLTGAEITTLYNGGLGLDYP